MERIRLGTVTISQSDIDSVVEVLKSSYVSPGPKTEQFERLVADAHGYKHGLALNSGQSAISVALEAAGMLKPLSEVSVPAVTYIASINGILQAGLNPILADVTPDCEAQMLYDTIEEEVDAHMPCHLFGRANDYRPHDDKFVIEDNCESMYAKNVGWGDVCVLSFFSSHLLTAGAGGVILTNNDDLYFKCWQLVNHGRKNWKSYSTCAEMKHKYVFDTVAHSFKFSDLNAALGVSQHYQAKEFIKKRRTNARYLTGNFKDIDELILPKHDGHTYMVYPIVCKDDSREALLAELHACEIETRMLMPITNQPIIRELYGNDVEDRFPNAKFLNKHGFFMGCHQNLTKDELHIMVDVIRKFY